MSVPYLTRKQWGAAPWKSDPHVVVDSERKSFFVHYHGAPPPTSTGISVPINVERIHLDNGWSGVGYNFMVDQDGTIYEGRGWSMVGAHCPGHNRSAWGVYVAVGGDQKPSDKALASVRALYDEGCARAGRKLAQKGHRDGKATACPGELLYAWVTGGMAVAHPSTPGAPARPSSQSLAPALQTLEAPVVIIKSPSGPKQYVTDWLTKRHITPATRTVLIERGHEYLGERLSQADLDAIPEVTA